MYNGGSEERELLFKVKGAVYKTVSKMFMERYRILIKQIAVFPTPHPNVKWVSAEGLDAMHYCSLPLLTQDSCDPKLTLILPCFF